MIPEHDDPLVARLWRGVSTQAPDALLDARILKAARLQRRRRMLAPLAATLAACLVIAVFVIQSQRAPLAEMALPDTSTFGLYERRAGAPLAEAEVMQQVRRLPGGSEYSEVVYP